MEEITCMSRNSFVGRSGASQLRKKFLCYCITSPFPSRREHSTHLGTVQTVWFQFICVHLDSRALVMHRSVDGIDWPAPR